MFYRHMYKFENLQVLYYAEKYNLNRLNFDSRLNVIYFNNPYRFQ